MMEGHTTAYCDPLSLLFSGLLLVGIGLLARSAWSWPTVGRTKWSMLAGAVITAVMVAGVIVGGLLVLEIEGLPYNLKEAFTTHWPSLSLGLIALVILTTGALPMWLARSWLRDPSKFLKTGALGAVLASGVVFVAFWLALPAESQDDLLGSPVWLLRWRADGLSASELPWKGLVNVVERLYRFIGGYLGMLVGLTVGARLALGGPDRRWWPGLAELLGLGLISYIVTVLWTPTDNIVELLRGGGNIVCVVAAFASLVILGLAAGLLGRAALLLYQRQVRPAIVGLLAMAASLPIGWHLFVAATTPCLHKYGQVFSARQFLLSPNRGHYLGDDQLIWRYAVIHVVAIVILAAGMLVGLLVSPEREDG